MPRSDLVAVEERAVEVLLGIGDGVKRVTTGSKPSGDRRRKGAAGPMGISRVYAWRDEPFNGCAVVDDVDRFTIAMAALDDDETHATRVYRPGSFDHIGIGGDRPPRENLRFRYVGSHDERE